MIGSKTALKHSRDSRWLARLGLFLQLLVGVLLLAAVAWKLRDQPVAASWIGMGLILYLAILWRYPAAWLVVLPALLPVLDLTPWTGRLYVGEYDLFVALTLATGFMRGFLARIPPLDVRGFYPALAVLVLANLLGLVLAFQGGAAELNVDYSHYYSPLNGLREAKGLLAALLLFAMLEFERRQQRPVPLLLGAGLLLGLLFAGLSIVWERLFFTGPFDFTQAYRATGMFAAMHLGGASVDGFFVLTLPFVALLFMAARGKLMQIGALVLFTLALYAFLVTFSRANYLAFVVMVTVAVIGDYSIRRGSRVLQAQTLKWGLAVTLVTSAVALPILSGGFVQSRLVSVPEDTETRLTHWSEVLDSMNPSLSGILFGNGVGSFPRVFRDYRLMEQGRYLPQLTAMSEQGDRFVRFSASDKAGALFLRQRIAIPETGEAILSLRMRGHADSPDKLLVEICEMNILRALSECQWLGIQLNAARPGEWTEYNRPVDLGHFGRRFLGFSRPVDLLLLNRGLAGAVDIDEVGLTARDGTNLIANGSFDSALDHWLFNSGDHLLWHAKNIFLHLLFEIGLVGLAAFMLLLAIMLIHLLDRLANGDRWALMVLIALSGFLTLGAFDTLIDDPRIAMLFFFLLFTAVSPLTLDAARTSGVFLPWARITVAVMLMLFALAVVVLVHTSLTHRLPPRELARLALARAEIDWPWLEHALTPRLQPSVPIAQIFPEWRPLPASGFAPDAQTLRIGTRVFDSIREALAVLRSGDTLDIGPGIYDTPLIIAVDNVIIRGHGHVVLEHGTAEGKAHIVIRGTGVRLHNLECRYIRVPDGNGACIRLEGKDLLVEHVYFHDSEQGILTGSNPGFVHLRDSRFERFNSTKLLSHGIYVGGGKLLIEDSLFLASQHEGHEIKSRAQVTTIQRSIIASLSAVDSRLIDVSNGGTLIVEDSLLAQGPNSSNPDAIGITLEGSHWPDDRVILRGNLILLERNGSNRLLHLGNDQTSVEVLGNLIISASKTDYDSGNIVFKTRQEAGLPEYPALPLERFLPSNPGFQIQSEP